MQFSLFQAANNEVVATGDRSSRLQPDLDRMFCDQIIESSGKVRSGPEIHAVEIQPRIIGLPCPSLGVSIDIARWRNCAILIQT